MKYLSPDVAPNTEFGDVILSLRQFLPWNLFAWRSERGADLLEAEFAGFFPEATEIFSLARGRDALQLVLKAADISHGDVVLLQAFTCVVVPNAIIATGATPEYIDIDDTYNMSVNELRRQIENATVKAIIVQHTFGTPADIEVIAALCQEHQVLLIEDCAHSLGATHNGQLVGSFGDAAIFSFGRDKVISGVSGGMLVVKNEKLASRTRDLYRSIPKSGWLWIFQHLTHVSLYWKVRKFYYVLGIGKLLAVLARKIGVVAAVLSPSEKHGKAPSLTKLPNPLAKLALYQLEKMPVFIEHRKSIAALYDSYFHEMPGIVVQGSVEGSTFLRYSIAVDRRDELFSYMKSKRIPLGDWYTVPVGPADTDLQAACYVNTNCVQAEKLAREVLNLPTHIHITEKDAHMIAQHIVEFLKQ